jgi:hypothetical protein
MQQLPHCLASFSSVLTSRGHPGRQQQRALRKEEKVMCKHHVQRK